MVEMSTYHAQISRDGKFWLIHVPEVGRWTQARTVPEIDEMARDLIAIMDEVDPDSVDPDINITLPDAVEKHLRRAEELERQSRGQHSSADRQTSGSRQYRAF